MHSFQLSARFCFWYNYKQCCYDTRALSFFCRYTDELPSTWDNYVAASSHVPWQLTKVFFKNMLKCTALSLGRSTVLCLYNMPVTVPLWRLFHLHCAEKGTEVRRVGKPARWEQPSSSNPGTSDLTCSSLPTILCCSPHTGNSLQWLPILLNWACVPTAVCWVWT